MSFLANSRMVVMTPRVMFPTPARNDEASWLAAVAISLNLDSLMFPTERKKGQEVGPGDC